VTAIFARLSLGCFCLTHSGRLLFPQFLAFLGTILAGFGDQFWQAFLGPILVHFCGYYFDQTPSVLFDGTIV
jgi:hypothetical protein